MPVDPQIAALLTLGAGSPATETLTVAAARAQYEARIPLMAQPAAVAGVREETIDGPGGPLRLRIYTPSGAGLFPLLVFFHGSGFVLCSLDTHDGICRNLAAGSGSVVVSVDYGLAPEHPFPEGLDDCLHATRWAATQASALGADPARIAVAGDSAGGNLAAVVARRLRDESGPSLRAQLLIYPVTDHYTAAMPSYAARATGYGLTRATMMWFLDHYLPREADRTTPDASPLRAKNLAGLPPAFVATAEYDPLCDEGERYADRLRAAGVDTRLRRYDGMNHGFLFWAGRVDVAGAAMAEMCAWLQTQLAP